LSAQLLGFRITGIQPAAGQVTLNWDGQAGMTYTILASPSVQGPYSLAARQTASSNGPMSVTIASPGPIQFYSLAAAF
jgi:hypothetical protein